MPGALAGKIAMVTGGTRGIGYAIASRLLEDGAEVLVTGCSFQGQGPVGSRYIGADFANPSALAAFAEQAAKLDIDILVNNAGINKIAPFAEIDLADYERIQVVNLRAPFLLCRAVLPRMRAQRWGRIVNISSIFGIVAKEHRGSYAASKFGLDGLTAALAAEAAEDGVLANCVSPGFIDTELTRRVLGEKGIADLVKRVPIRRLGLPAEVAALVVWLAGPENTFISGQNIAIDGGFTRV